MTQNVNWSRFLRVLYPTAIFLFFALAWNTTGHEVKVDFKPPQKWNEPSWRAPAAAVACTVDHVSYQKTSSCGSAFTNE